MKTTTLLIVLFFLNFLLFAQNEDSSVSSFVGFQGHYGFIIPHAIAIEPVSNTNPFGFELSLGKLKTSFESWNIFNHYNITGIQAGYFNFQNPEIVGSTFILILFTEPIIMYSKKYIFSLRTGAGISYQTKIYDPKTNELNKFFSTGIAFPLYLRAGLKYRISDKAYITLSGSYNHISNGAIKVPNYGINFPTVSLGVEFFQNHIPHLENVFTAIMNKKLSDQYFIIQALTGYKVVYGEPVYSFGLHTRYTRQIRTKYSLNAGAEIMFDGGEKRMIKIEDLDLDYKRIAFTIGHDLQFRNLFFTQYFGFYLYAPYKPERFVYQKYELSYKVYPKLFAGIFLRAYASHAELLGLSSTYVFRIK